MALDFALVAAPCWLPPRLAPRPLPAAVVSSLSALAASTASDDSSEQVIGQNFANFDWNFGTIYALLCLAVYASIAMQGRSGVMMRNGKVFQNGIEVAQPFKQSAEDAAVAAAAAARAEKEKDEEKRS